MSYHFSVMPPSEVLNEPIKTEIFFKIKAFCRNKNSHYKNKNHNEYEIKGSIRSQNT